MSTKVPTTDMIELESLFGPLFDEYLNGVNQVVSKSFAVTAADAPDKRQQQPDSTSSTSTLATTVTADENFDVSYTLSWKPCQGDSLNLPDHMYSIYTIKRETRGLDDGVTALFQRSRIHKPHAHTQAFKVNRTTLKSLTLNFPTIKEPQSQIKNRLLGKIVRLMNIYVKQECNKYEHVGQEHKMIENEAGNSQRFEKKAVGLEDDNDMHVDNEEGGGEAKSNCKGDMSCGDEGDDDYKSIYDGGGGLAAGFGERNGGEDEESRFLGELRVKDTFNGEYGSPKKETTNYKNIRESRTNNGNTLGDIGNRCINDGSRPALDVNLEVSTGLDNMEVGYKKEFNSVSPTDKYIRRGYKGLNIKYVVNKNKQQNIQKGSKTDTEKNEKLAQDSPMGRRDKGVISSPGSTGSAGVRLRKKRKASGEGMFDCDEEEMTFNQGKMIVEKGKDKKKIGRRSITKAMEVARKTRIKGLGENKKRVSDEYKVYHEVSSENKEIFHFGSGKEDDEDSVRCNVNMEQVKKIGEIIGVSWVRAEEEAKDKNCNC
ncbi:hypothetical protein Tco_1328220 [Tanacetum coccineum]